MFESEETRLVDVPVITSALVASSTRPLTVVLALGVAVVTNAVVARAVVLLPAVCVTPVVPVGKDGVPLKA
jgi:hypothetical protein